jgi:hypothetical protein
MRTSVFGAVGLLCFGALLLGTWGGRELVVAVVGLGPALTVLMLVAVRVAPVPDEVGVADELGLVADREELWERLDPPHPVMSSAVRRAAQTSCRGIGAL